MNTRTRTHQLADMIHDKNLSSGEIWKLSDLTRDIYEMERDGGFTFTGEEILTAWRDAGERFVDSMQTNTFDGYTYECRHRETETEYQEELDRWEAMRPSVVHMAQVSRATFPCYHSPKPHHIMKSLAQTLAAAVSTLERFDDTNHPAIPFWEDILENMKSLLPSGSPEPLNNLQNMTAPSDISPELQARFDFPIVCRNGRLGFWNWNKSAFIVVGDSEAEIWSDLNTPHQPEDSLGLGHFNS